MIGGNISILCASLGTPWQPPFRGRILFLEDLDEVPYRFDRMLNEHRIFTYLTTSDRVHARLGGRDHDLMTMMKSAFLSIAARSVDGISTEDWALGFAHYAPDSDLEFDIAYLDEDDDA